MSPVSTTWLAELGAEAPRPVAGDGPAHGQAHCSACQSDQSGCHTTVSDQGTWKRGHQPSGGTDQRFQGRHQPRDRGRPLLHSCKIGRMRLLSAPTRQFILDRRVPLVTLLATRKYPSRPSTFRREFVEFGGLMSYGASQDLARYRRRSGSKCRTRPQGRETGRHAGRADRPGSSWSSICRPRGTTGIVVPPSLLAQSRRGDRVTMKRRDFVTLLGCRRGGRRAAAPARATAEDRNDRRSRYRQRQSPMNT